MTPVLAARRPTLVHAMRAMRGIVWREIVKFMRQYGRLASALVRPALWLVVFAAGMQNLFGVSPRYEDITWDGLDFSSEQFKSITAIDAEAWRKELGLHAELFDKLRGHLPAELASHHARLSAQL